MFVTKRDIRNHGQVIIDQNANLNVKDANVRGDLRVHGKILQVNEDDNYIAPLTSLALPANAPPYCELTMNVMTDICVEDNEPFVWSVLVDDLNMFDGQSIVTIPVNGIYSVVSRVYNADVDSNGSGTTLWMNGDYTYSSVNAREGDHTSSMTNIRPFRQGDKLQIKSVLRTLILANHKQCYTFQITKL